MSGKPKERGWAILSLLGQEVTLAMRIQSKPEVVDPQFARRVLIRTIFTTLDGYASCLSKLTLENETLAESMLSADQLGCLRQGKHVKRPDGSSEFKRHHPPLRRRLNTAIECYRKVRDAKKAPPMELPPSFEVAKAVRNRLTHPNHSSDFHVSAEELKAIADIGPWLIAIAGWAKDVDLEHIERIKLELHQSYQEAIRRLQAEKP